MSKNSILVGLLVFVAVTLTTQISSYAINKKDIQINRLVSEICRYAKANKPDCIDQRIKWSKK